MGTPYYRARQAEEQARQRFAIVLCIAALLAAVYPLAAHSRDADAIQADAYEVRAALILNLARFVTGPPERFSPLDEKFRIGMMGPPGLVRAFESIEGRIVGGRKVQIHTLASDSSPSLYYQVLYNGSNQNEVFRAQVERCPNPYVLTIGEGSPNVDTGNMISISEKDQHLALTIYRQRTKQAELAVSSHLLRLATVIDGEQP